MKNYTITVNGNVYDVTVEETGSTPKVNSPMPGKILSIKVEEGASVKKGDVMFVLEAMKMENEIVAPEDGTVASINASTGEEVEAGAVLASLN